jgi:serine/threonine protein kinase
MSEPILNQRYKLHKRISRKGARQTFFATDITSQTPVIVKILLFGHDFEWQEYKLFERGSHTLKHLDHPQIPRYLDYFDVSFNKAKGFAQVQGYIEAPSLQEHLERGRSFSEDELRQIARQLLEILIYLQQLHPPILHRDIKPSNILLGERSGNSVGQVYLVDFDSIKTHSSTPVGQTMTIVGTYGYMAPEQFGGKAYPASDLYSLAATLVAIASGKTPSDLPQKEFRIDFESEVTLTPDFVSWLKWMLEPSLDLRLKLAAEALNSLDNNEQIPSRLKASPLIYKPNDSRIILRQDSQQIEVIILPPGLSLSSKIVTRPSVIIFMVGLVLCIPALMLFTIAIFVFLNFSFSSLFFSILVIIFAAIFGLPALLCMYPLLRLMFLSTHLEIKGNQIAMFQKMLLKYKLKKAARASIQRITIDTDRILIHTASNTFKLSTTSHAEATWLAHQLSSFLKIPIQSKVA